MLPPPNTCLAPAMRSSRKEGVAWILHCYIGFRQARRWRLISPHKPPVTISSHRRAHEPPDRTLGGSGRGRVEARPRARADVLQNSAATAVVVELELHGRSYTQTDNQRGQWRRGSHAAAPEQKPWALQEQKHENYTSPSNRIYRAVSELSKPSSGQCCQSRVLVRVGKSNITGFVCLYNAKTIFVHDRTLDHSRFASTTPRHSQCYPPSYRTTSDRQSYARWAGSADRIRATSRSHVGAEHEQPRRHRMQDATTSPELTLRVETRPIAPPPASNL